LGAYHRHADRYQARLQVVKLSYQGWSKRSISQFMQGSRPPVDRWMQRFAAEPFAGLADKSRVPHTTPRKVWLSLMIALYHLHKRHPDAGELRLWSLLANDPISVRTVGRVLALNKQVSDDSPHVPEKQAQKPPGPHPYNATAAHPYWFIDGRRMDVALDGVNWWSILLLGGYSRTILAGAMAPAEARWAALLVLYTPRSRGLSEHRAFSCEERCIPAHMQGWGYRLEEDFGQKCQRWVVTRDAAWRCEHDDCNIAVFKRTLLSILHSPSRTIPSSDAKIAWFNLTP
jgi:hypothetical protein